MKQFGKIFKFELKNYAKNKAFVGVTIFLMVVIAIVMFFPRITALFESDDTSDTTADLSVMLVKADDPTQADMVRETFAASFIFSFVTFVIISIPLSFFIKRKAPFLKEETVLFWRRQPDSDW